MLLSDWNSEIDFFLLWNYFFLFHCLKERRNRIWQIYNWYSIMAKSIVAAGTFAINGQWAEKEKEKKTLLKEKMVVDDDDNDNLLVVGKVTCYYLYCAIRLQCSTNVLVLNSTFFLIRNQYI